MEYKIGKRYSWSPFCSGINKWKNGILEGIYTDNKGAYGIFVTNSQEEWKIYLPSENIVEYKRNKYD